MTLTETLDDLLLEGLPDLVRIEDLIDLLPADLRAKGRPRLAVARWLRSIGAKDHTRYTKGDRPAFRLWSLRRHEAWAAIGAADRLERYLADQA